MINRWKSQLYRSPEEGDGMGFSTANADNLADLYTDDDTPTQTVSMDGNQPATPDPAVPAQPAAAPAAPVEPAQPAEPVQPAAPAQPVQPAAQPQPAQPVVQPSAPAAPVTEPPAQPAAAVAVPSEPAQPAQPAAPVEPQETEAQRTERLNAERVKLTGELERMYAIPEAEVDSFRETPEQYLPKLAAKLHVEVLTAVANGIYAQLPNLMNGILNAQRQQQTYEEKFFSRWQKLNTPALRPQVLELVTKYRQLNPAASFETLSDEVGAMAHVRFRVPFEDAPAAPPASAAPATTPAPAARPFVPAGTGSAAPPSAPVESNQFTQLANEFLSEPGGW